MLSILALNTILILAASTAATAIPAAIAAPDLALRNDLYEVNLTIPSPGLAALSSQVTGVSGTLAVRFIDRNTIQSWYSVTDTASDKHPVYMTTVLYSGSDDVLRCDNKLGSGNTGICDWRQKSRSKDITAVAAKACVNVQLGGDKCVTGPKIRNPRIPA